MARAGKMIFLSERGDDKNDGLTAEVTARVRVTKTGARGTQRLGQSGAA
jgi:hypothetical protein